MNVSPQRTTQLTNWTQYIDELSFLVHNKEGDEYSVGVVICFLHCARYLFVLLQIYSSLRERTIHIYIQFMSIIFLKSMSLRLYHRARFLLPWQREPQRAAESERSVRTSGTEAAETTRIHSRRWSVCHFALIFLLGVVANSLFISSSILCVISICKEHKYLWRRSFLVNNKCI